MKIRLDSRVLGAATALCLVTGCGTDMPTSPTTTPTVSTAPNRATQMDWASSPTGERIVGRSAIEPAYNADSGDLMYLLTPMGVPFPAKSNPNSWSPLYMVVYPPNSTAAGDGHFNCEGVPGNCPDHSGLAAGIATHAQPNVYGADSTAVPGHDHVADPPGKPDFNIAWRVIEVVFTEQGMNDGAVDTRLTTDSQIMAAIDAGDAIPIDLGIAFNCSVVPATLYWRGTPVG